MNLAVLLLPILVTKACDYVLEAQKQRRDSDEIRKIKERLDALEKGKRP